MKSKIGIILMMYVCFVGCAKAVSPKTNQKEPAIAVMYHHPELAEEYCRSTVSTFALEPETLKITYCRAQYIPLYRAYVVNCFFDTNDAYGDLQSYKIQMKLQVLPDCNDGIKYNVLDLKELR